MSTPEFLTWVEFHKLYPIDDRARVFKPFAMLAAMKTKDGRIEPFLDILEPDPKNADFNEADLNSMRAMGYKRKGG